MSFEDEKFFSSWGAIFFAFLVLINFEYVPGFRWIGFLSIETALGLYGLFRFKKQERPDYIFYRWGLLLWSSLFVAYSSFALYLLSRSFGETWLWFFVPAWILFSFLLVRSMFRWEDGSTRSSTGVMTWAIAAGVSLSSVVMFYVSKKAFKFGTTMMLDMLLSFVMICGLTVWLRRLAKSSHAAN